jgi:hypothetical protein
VQWIAVCAVACLARPALAQEPSLATVLVRAGAYVAEFQRQFSGIVAEERYAQEIKAVGRHSPCDAYDMPVAMQACRDRLTSPLRSELRSDLLLVKPAGAKDWLQFRDVFEVDGLPVRDRTERLTRLFLDPSPSSSHQIETIREDSARYNIGDIERNLNVPLFALSFLAPGHQARFKFTRTADRAPATAAATAAPADGRGAPFHVSTQVWVVEYREVARGTIIHTNRNKDLPARGRFWIEPETGRVLMTELVARNRELRATIDVSYQSEPLVGLLVPIEMREWYDGLRSGSRIEAVARYGKFRQFQVNTNETFLIKK